MTYRTILKNFIIFCVMMFVMSIKSYAADASGICGVDVTWSLVDGNLTIQGNGLMSNYTEQNRAPWDSYNEQIQTVTVLDGIKNVGDLAFYHIPNLTMVNLADSVEEIGDYSFAGCAKVSQVVFGDGLIRIGQSAFDSCESLTNVSFPESLYSLGEKAFYRCSSLGGITIPYNTLELGMNVFGYCYNLVYVRIDAPIKVLPYWFFYGCSRLKDLYLPETLESIQENAIAECLELAYVHFEGDTSVKAQIEEELRKPSISEINPEVNVKVDYKELEDSTITTTQTKENIVDKDGNSIPADTQIDATIKGENGWKDIVVEANNKIKDDVPSVVINVEFFDGSWNSEDLSDLLGKNVRVNIHTPNNVYWQIDMVDQSEESLKKKQNLELSIKKNNENADWQKAIIGESNSYIVEFGETSIYSTVLIPLGIEWARYTATLYKIDNKNLEEIQSVIVDNHGRVAFSLAGTAEGKYLVALNVDAVSEEEVIIPQVLYDEYSFEDGVSLMDSRGNRYKITRRESDWGMDINQVTWILVGVLTATVVAVGVIMYILNKRSQILSQDQE